MTVTVKTTSSMNHRVEGPNPGRLVIMVDGFELTFADSAHVTATEINEAINASPARGRVYVETQAQAKERAKLQREAARKARVMRVERAKLRGRLIRFVKNTPLKRLKYEDGCVLVEAIKSYFYEGGDDR